MNSKINFRDSQTQSQISLTSKSTSQINLKTCTKLCKHIKQINQTFTDHVILSMLFNHSKYNKEKKNSDNMNKPEW